MGTTINNPEKWVNENERTFFNLLKDCLHKDFRIYAGYKNSTDIESGDIDFLVYHPNYGVWVIEQKSYRLEDLIDVSNNDRWIIKKGAREESILNPFIQASKNTDYILGTLKKSHRLVNKDGYHKGQLKFPINYFVVFDNMTIKDLKTCSMYSEERTLTKDFLFDKQLDEGNWAEKFKTLRGKAAFSTNLTSYEIEEIEKALKLKNTIKAIDKKELGITDERQENLINADFNQHLLIEGPAGSGKTVIIVLRAIQIKRQYPDWKVAIFVFTKFMANYISAMLKAYDETTSIEIPVYSIYEFAENNCNNKPDYIKFKKIDSNNFFEPALLEAINSGFKNNLKIDAILIDEGQDIKEIHAVLYSKLVIEENSSVTICYDSRQDIYGGDSFIDNLNKHGFKFPSRAKPLVKQQRSLLIFLGVALYEQIKNPSKEIAEIVRETEDTTKRMFFNEIGEIFEKEFRDNKVVGFFKGLYKTGKLAVNRLVNNDSLSKELNSRIEIINKKSTKEIIEEIALTIKSLVEANENIKLLDCLVLYPNHKDKETNEYIVNYVSECFQTLEIPFIYIGDSSNVSPKPKPKEYDGKAIVEYSDNRLTADLNSDTVKVMTAHLAKGFDRKYVFVINFDDIDIQRIDQQNKPHSLSYVILTRAVEKCFIYYKKNTDIIKRLKTLTDYIHDNEL
jgi:hypothetical protein